MMRQSSPLPRTRCPHWARGARALLVLALAPITTHAQAPSAMSPRSLDHPRAQAPHGARGQSELDTLIGIALGQNPTVLAAAARLQAARARVPQAGARPDPRLMVGLLNFPFAEPGFTDFMAMKMVGVTQSFPFPGKLRLQTSVAEFELEAAGANIVAARLDLVRDVKSAYYSLVRIGQLLDVVARNQRLVVELTQVAAASYRVGRAGQEDVLRAQVDAAGLSNEASTLSELRRSALGQLNALLNRDTEAPVAALVIPAAIVHAAVSDGARRVRFASAILGSRLSDSPFPSLDSLQRLAVRHNALLRAHEAHLRAQALRVEVARKAALPDIDLSVSYSQRTGFTDMLSATVSLPLPLQYHRKYGQAAAEADANLLALESEHNVLVNDVKAEVNRLVSQLERDRTELALYTGAILPQARTALDVAMAGFRVGRADFLTLIDRQATLYNYETQNVRTLADFATSVAALEAVVGQELLP